VKLSQIKRQFRKPFVLIVTIEYQNVQALMNVYPLIIGPALAMVGAAFNI
jgi:hypothetical protein